MRAKKLNCEKKKQVKKNPENMTLFDLITYNPKDNAMPQKKKTVIADNREEEDIVNNEGLEGPAETNINDIHDEQRQMEENDSNILSNTNGEENDSNISNTNGEENDLNEEGITETGEMSTAMEDNLNEGITETDEMSTAMEDNLNDGIAETDEMSDSDDDFSGGCPQFKLGANGEIILDAESLAIATTDSKKAKELENTSHEIIEQDDTMGKYNKKRGRGYEWTPNETKRFYKALVTVGTDFSLMQSLFEWRTRNELKLKYKKEEKNNKDLVDKAIMGGAQFDMSFFENMEFDIQEDRKKAKEHKLKKLKLEVKQRADKAKKAAKLAKLKQKENNKNSKKVLRETFKKNRKKKKKEEESTITINSDEKSTITINSDEIVIEITLNNTAVDTNTNCDE